MPFLPLLSVLYFPVFTMSSILADRVSRATLQAVADAETFARSLETLSDLHRCPQTGEIVFRGNNETLSAMIAIMARVNQALESIDPLIISR